MHRDSRVSIYLFLLNVFSLPFLGVIKVKRGEVVQAIKKWWNGRNLGQINWTSSGAIFDMFSTKILPYLKSYCWNTKCFYLKKRELLSEHKKYKSLASLKPYGGSYPRKPRMTQLLLGHHSRFAIRYTVKPKWHESGLNLQMWIDVGEYHRYMFRSDGLNGTTSMPKSVRRKGIYTTKGSSKRKLVKGDRWQID